MAKRIVVLGTRGIPNVQGGVETHVEQLFPYLVEFGYEVIVLCRNCYIPENKRVASYKGITLKYLYTPRKKSFEAIIHTFLGVFKAKKLKADILHVHAIGPALMIPLAKLLGLKVVFTHHGPDYNRQKWGWVAKKMLKAGESLGVRFADKVIVISQTIRSYVEELYGRKDLVVIPNGVTEKAFLYTTHRLIQWGIVPYKYIITVARFVEEKGLHDLIEAYKQGDFASQGFQLVIAGDADHETNYSRRLKKVGNETPGVLMTGYVKGNALEELYSHAKLFVLPSYHEGLPFALLEAMSYKLPILVSNIDPHIEIELNEKSYFSVGDIQDLKIKLKYHLEQNQKSDYSELLKRYSWDRIASKISDHYENVVKV